ncbi:MAG: D-alanine--D-alanine ligase family protein [Oscillospiraceae bacterium]|nr:D-alanine--D-alanine ligase family protein [Oscillospiraceae bacterium]
MKPVVAVLFGGVSSEHEISLLSAASILKNFPFDRYEPVLIGITKEGRWLYYTGEADALPEGRWEAGPCMPAFITPDRGVHGFLYQTPGGWAQKRLDAVFPVLHGKNGEDGTIQGLLELANIPYVGCGVLGSAVCMDKAVANQLMEQNGIPRCEWAHITRADLAGLADILPKLEQKLGYPIFVKPANAGSSVGISKAVDRPALEKAVALAFQHDDRVVFERFVDGQEVECAVIGGDAAEASLPGEILSSADFYDYEDKYLSGSSTTAIPARLPPEKLEEVRALAVKAYRALCCRGLSRVDFFVERATGRVLLNEINTLPGFTSISMYPKLMTQAGRSYQGLIAELIGLALGEEAAS